jgi:predicted nucleic acid-binding protein
MTVPAGVVLDAGVFLALERRTKRIVELVQYWREVDTKLVTSVGVLAQVWRGGRNKQAPLSSVLARTEVVDITSQAARAIGLVLGLTRTADIVDVHVAMLARERRWPVITSDPEDMRTVGGPKLVIGVV